MSAVDDPEDEVTRIRRAQDRDDFNNEMAGRDTGRARRFLPEEQPEKRRTRETDEAFLWRMALQERVEAFRRRLDDLDRVSLEALQRAERRVWETQARLDRLRQDATRDEQGRLVFRTADGQTGFYENAQEMSADAFGSVDWREGAPTWEDRQQADEENRQALEHLDAVGAYRDRLDTARERLDQERPLTVAELDELEASVATVPEPALTQSGAGGPLMAGEDMSGREAEVARRSPAANRSTGPAQR